MKVQLLTFPDCPNATAARELVRRVLRSSYPGARIEEVDTSAPEIQDRLRGWASPTILVDGEDIEGQSSPGGSSCRLYRDAAGHRSAVPPEPVLRAALDRAAASGRH